MIPEVNYWAVLVATLSTLVVGSVWYTPKVFGTRWMRLAKVDPKAAEVARMITHDAFKGRPPALTTLNLAHELVTILVMAVIIGVWPPAGV